MANIKSKLIQNSSSTTKLCCWLLIFYCTFMTFNLVESIGYCAEHRFNTSSTNSNHMQFSKEVINREYGLLDSLKGLHCCAKGYRSIEWFKDGKPYPWSSKDSSLILFPEASNQTIYTRRVQLTDAGNYTCILRNDTHIITQHISLQIEENNPDMPQSIFKPHDQFVDLENPSRFYCAAFVGKVSLPDARNEISWWKILENGGKIEAEGSQIQISRENGQIVGSYYEISNVQIHNYGRYECRIQMGDASHKLEMYAQLYGAPIKAVNDQTVVLGILAGITACIITLILLYFLSKIFHNNKINNNNCQALMNSERNDNFNTPRCV